MQNVNQYKKKFLILMVIPLLFNSYKSLGNSKEEDLISQLTEMNLIKKVEGREQLMGKNYLKLAKNFTKSQQLPLDYLQLLFSSIPDLLKQIMEVSRFMEQIDQCTDKKQLLEILTTGTEENTQNLIQEIDSTDLDEAKNIIYQQTLFSLIRKVINIISKLNVNKEENETFSLDRMLEIMKQNKQMLKIEGIEDFVKQISAKTGKNKYNPTQISELLKSQLIQILLEQILPDPNMASLPRIIAEVFTTGYNKALSKGETETTAILQSCSQVLVDKLRDEDSELSIVLSKMDLISRPKDVEFSKEQLEKAVEINIKDDVSVKKKSNGSNNGFYAVAGGTVGAVGVYGLSDDQKLIKDFLKSVNSKKIFTKKNNIK